MCSLHDYLFSFFAVAVVMILSSCVSAVEMLIFLLRVSLGVNFVFICSVVMAFNASAQHPQLSPFQTTVSAASPVKYYSK